MQEVSLLSRASQKSSVVMLLLNCVNLLMGEASHHTKLRESLDG